MGGRWISGGGASASLTGATLPFGAFTPGPIPPEPVSLSFFPPLDTLSRTPGAGDLPRAVLSALDGRPLRVPGPFSGLPGSVLSFDFFGRPRRFCAFSSSLISSRDFSQGGFSSFPNKSRNASSLCLGEPSSTAGASAFDTASRAAARRWDISSLILSKSTTTSPGAVRAGASPPTPERTVCSGWGTGPVSGSAGSTVFSGAAVSGAFSTGASPGLSEPGDSGPVFSLSSAIH